MDARVFAFVRHLVENLLPDGAEDQQLHLNPRGDLIVTQALPTGAELARMGRSFQAILATAVAPVVAIPTTASLMGLWNGEPDGGRTYVIDGIGVLTVALTAAQQIATPIVNLSSVKPAAQAVSAVLPKNMRAGSPATSRAAIVLGGTLAVATDNWFPPPGSTSPGTGAASTFGQNVDADAKGLLQIAPGHILNINAISTAATATSILIYVRWHEVKFPTLL